MPDIRTITGIIHDQEGNALPNTELRIGRGRVFGQGGAVVVPLTSHVVSDALGYVSFDLYAGTYAAYVESDDPVNGKTVQLKFTINVPQDGSADLADIIDGPAVPLTPSDVLLVQSLRDETETLRDDTIDAAARLYDTLAALLADTAVYPVGTRLSVRGGGTYEVVASGGDLQRGDGESLNVLPIGPSVPVYSASALGLDMTGGQDCSSVINSIIARETGGVRFVVDGVIGVSSPIVVPQGRHRVQFVGRGSGDEAESGVCAIKKISDFSGDAAVIVGTAGSTGQIDGFLMEGIRVDGNGQTGDGIQLWRCGKPIVRNVYAHGNSSGWGFRVDGCFFPLLDHCSARKNGNSAAAQGGGFFLSNTNRENSDGEMMGCFANSNGNTNLMMDARASTGSNSRQTDWTIVAGEFSDDLANYSPSTPMNSIAWLKSADRIKLVATKFTQASNPTNGGADKCLRIGVSGGAADAIDKLSMLSCGFQQTKSGGYGIDVVGGLSTMSLFDPHLEGAQKLIDASAVSSGVISLYGSSIDIGLFNDPNNIISGANVRNGIVGYRPGGSSAQFLIKPRTNGDQLLLQTASAGGVTRTLKFGFGTDQDEMNMEGGLGLRFAPLSAAPANPTQGRVALANQSGWDPLGLGSVGPYFVWWNGSAWRGLHESSNGTNLS